MEISNVLILFFIHSNSIVFIRFTHETRKTVEVPSIPRNETSIPTQGQWLNHHTGVDRAISLIGQRTREARDEKERVDCGLDSFLDLTDLCLASSTNDLAYVTDREIMCGQSESRHKDHDRCSTAGCSAGPSFVIS